MSSFSSRQILHHARNNRIPIALRSQWHKLHRYDPVDQARARFRFFASLFFALICFCVALLLIVDRTLFGWISDFGVIGYARTSASRYFMFDGYVVVNFILIGLGVFGLLMMIVFLCLDEDHRPFGSMSKPRFGDLLGEYLHYLQEISRYDELTSRIMQDMQYKDINELRIPAVGLLVDIAFRHLALQRSALPTAGPTFETPAERDNRLAEWAKAFNYRYAILGEKGLGLVHGGHSYFYNEAKKKLKEERTLEVV